MSEFIKPKPNVLLVWNNSPENIDYYLIPMHEPIIKDIVKANGYYINEVIDNVETEEALNRVNDWLPKHDKYKVHTNLRIEQNIRISLVCELGCIL